MKLVRWDAKSTMFPTKFIMGKKLSKDFQASFGTEEEVQTLDILCEDEILEIAGSVKLVLYLKKRT